MRQRNVATTCNEPTDQTNPEQRSADTPLLLFRAIFALLIVSDSAKRASKWPLPTSMNFPDRAGNFGWPGLSVVTQPRQTPSHFDSRKPSCHSRLPKYPVEPLTSAVSGRREFLPSIQAALDHFQSSGRSTEPRRTGLA
jgi:hypothetical protein